MGEVVEMKTEQEQFLAEIGVDKHKFSAIRASIFPDPNVSDRSIALYMQYCYARKLDPLKRPAHIVPMKVGDVWKDVIMMGISELRTTAARSGLYAGADPAKLGDKIKLKFGGVQIEVPEYCSFTVYKMVDGHRCPYTHTEYFKECCATKGKTGPLNYMWNKRPIGQMTKCAEAGALRMAFPEELGGELTVDEMEGKEIVEHKPEWLEDSLPQEQVDRYLKLIKDSDAIELIAYKQSFETGQQATLQGAYYDRAPRGKKGEYKDSLHALYKEGEEKLETLIMDMGSMLDSDDELGVKQILEESSPELVSLLKEKVEGLNEYQQ